MKSTLLSVAALVAAAASSPITCPQRLNSTSLEPRDDDDGWTYVEHYQPDKPSEKDPKEFDPEWAYCGTHATGLGWHMRHWIEGWDLNRWRNTFYMVNADECRRIMCSDTSAIYICNRTPNPKRHAATPLQRHIEYLTQACTPETYTEGPSSGQIFFDNGESSIVIGYSNCRHPKNRGPYYDKWGPNGEPHVIDKFAPPNWIPPEIFPQLDAEKYKDNRWYEGGDGNIYAPEPTMITTKIAPEPTPVAPEPTPAAAEPV